MQAPKLDRSFGFIIHDVARLMRRTYDRKVKAFDLTRSQWWLLANLSRKQGLTQTELAEEMDVGKAALGELLDRVEAKGWIERKPDAQDKRARRVYLTGDAEPILKAMQWNARDLHTQILCDLSPREVDALMEALVHIKTKLLQDLALAGNGGSESERKQDKGVSAGSG